MNELDLPTGGLPVEIRVVGELPAGAGGHLLRTAFGRQRLHPTFVDEYNEASALVGPTRFAAQDPTALYTFGVDHRPLVFHRHEGHRVITGVTGAGGCVLRFSPCSPEELTAHPETFLRRLVHVEIAPERMFTLRFSGTVYHQFAPRVEGEAGFFAVSVHTDESHGLKGELLEQVLADRGSIPLLTEPLPSNVQEFLAKCPDLEAVGLRYRLGHDTSGNT